MSSTRFPSQRDDLLGSAPVPRRLLAFAVVALACVSSAGCGDDVAPAARLGDTTIRNGALLDEVAEWASSPALVSGFGASSPGSYPTPLVDAVLTFRISVELHNAKFDELGLTITQQEIDDARAGLFQDPAQTAKVLGELSTSYGNQILENLARQTAVQQALGDGYQAWTVEAFTGIEVNPHYGSWDTASGNVVPPTGPIQRAAAFNTNGS